MPDIPERLKAALADRYRIERELGSGGMATVYLAADPKHRRKVAVKVLRPELAASLGADRFVREIDIAAQLTHPHILPLFDSGEADGYLYYVMPYIEGESLRERLNRKGKLSVGEGIRLTNQIASALSYAHERGVVHRDIKPENILLAGDQAIVADFGIARAVAAAGGERLTATGLAVGTPVYMSPEQAFSETNVDGRSDVYSLGCVVHELVSGRAPFDGSTPQELLAKHAVNTVPGLRASDPSIPLFVDRAVRKALAKRPGDRFPSPSAFAEALTSEAVVPRVGRRRRLAVAGAAAVAGVLATALWVATVGGGPDVERLAILPLTNLTNDPDQEYLVQGVHTALIDELASVGASVIARRSVMQYQDSDMRARDIAQELAVDAVIEGSVRRDGDRVEIGARLIDGGSEAQLWNQSFSGDLRNIVRLQREVTRAIVDEIDLRLTSEQQAHLASARAVNPEAYEAYLQGLFHHRKLTPPDLEVALQYFQLALRKDPDYALPYAGIALALTGQMQMGFLPPHEGTPLAQQAVESALELDSMLVEVQYALAVVKAWYEWDFAGAEAAFQRAIELNPNYPDARAFYSHLLMILGRPDEALAQIDRALELDPFNDLFQGLYGMDLLMARRYDDAIELFRNALRTAPNNPMTRVGLHDAYREKGMFDEALVELKAVYAFIEDREVVAAIERGYEVGGYHEAVRQAGEVLAVRARTSFVPSIDIAASFADAGDHDRALDWLERAYDARDPNMPYVGTWLWPDERMRADPRYRDLVRRMNLPLQ